MPVLTLSLYGHLQFDWCGQSFHLSMGTREPVPFSDEGIRGAPITRAKLKSLNVLLKLKLKFAVNEPPDKPPGIEKAYRQYPQSYRSETP